MRKSSRGNPYHDERGRFASADSHAIKSERPSEEYEARTKQRLWEDDRAKVAEAHQNAAGEVLFVNGNERCHASIVDNLPEKTCRWANGYSEVARYEHKGRTYTVFRDEDGYGQFAYFAVEDLKERQLRVILENNPKDPSINSAATWIESVDDIQTWEEAMHDDCYGEGDVAPDFTWADAQKAHKENSITIYSSKPIQLGSFVTPSRMIAVSYGNKNPYSMTVKLTDVAWIDMSEGQFTLKED